MASSEGQTELLTGWSCVVHQPSEDPEPSELPSTVDITAFSAGLNVEPASNSQCDDGSDSDSESESGSNNSGSDESGSYSQSDSSDSDSDSSSSTSSSPSPEFSVRSQPNGLRLTIATVRKSCSSPVVEKAIKSETKPPDKPKQPCDLSSSSETHHSSSESESNNDSDDNSEGPIVKTAVVKPEKESTKKVAKMKPKVSDKEKKVEKKPIKKDMTSPKNVKSKAKTKKKKMASLPLSRGSTSSSSDSEDSDADSAMLASCSLQEIRQEDLAAILPDQQECDAFDAFEETEKNSPQAGDASGSDMELPQQAVNAIIQRTTESSSESEFNPPPNPSSLFANSLLQQFAAQTQMLNTSVHPPQEVAGTSNQSETLKSNNSNDDSVKRKRGRPKKVRKNQALKKLIEKPLLSVEYAGDPNVSPDSGIQNSPDHVSSPDCSPLPAAKSKFVDTKRKSNEVKCSKSSTNSPNKVQPKLAVTSNRFDRILYGNADRVLYPPRRKAGRPPIGSKKGPGRPPKCKIQHSIVDKATVLKPENKISKIKKPKDEIVEVSKTTHLSEICDRVSKRLELNSKFVEKKEDAKKDKSKSNCKHSERIILGTKNKIMKNKYLTLKNSKLMHSKHKHKKHKKCKFKLLKPRTATYIDPKINSEIDKLIQDFVKFCNISTLKPAKENVPEILKVIKKVSKKRKIAEYTERKKKKVNTTTINKETNNEQRLPLKKRHYHMSTNNETKPDDIVQKVEDTDAKNKAKMVIATTKLLIEKKVDVTKSPSQSINKSTTTTNTSPKLNSINNNEYEAVDSHIDEAIEACISKYVLKPKEIKIEVPAPSEEKLTTTTPKKRHRLEQAQIATLEVKKEDNKEALDAVVSEMKLKRNLTAKLNELKRIDTSAQVNTRKKNRLEDLTSNLVSKINIIEELPTSKRKKEINEDRATVIKYPACKKAKPIEAENLERVEDKKPTGIFLPTVDLGLHIKEDIPKAEEVIVKESAVPVTVVQITKPVLITEVKKKVRKRRAINRTGFPTVKKKKKKLIPVEIAVKEIEPEPCDRVPKEGEEYSLFVERTEKTTIVENIKSTNDLYNVSKWEVMSECDSLPLEERIDFESLEVKQERMSLRHRDESPAFINVKIKRDRTPDSCASDLDDLTLEARMEKLKQNKKNKSKKKRKGLGRKCNENSTKKRLRDVSPTSSIDNEKKVVEERSSTSGDEYKKNKKAPRWRKKCLVAGLFSSYYKEDDETFKQKRNDLLTNKSKLVYNPSEHPYGLLPPPYHCGKYLRCRKTAFQLPYDLWWQHMHSQLPGRDLVPSWNYRKVRTNVYNVKNTTGACEPQSCNCKPQAGCGDDCINRLVLAECPASHKCLNQKIQKHEWAPGIEKFMTEHKGWGVKTNQAIKHSDFILEYVGEVVSDQEFKERMATRYIHDTHHYCLHLDSGLLIDGHRMGGDGRFVNHSCQPNCEMQKWSVNGQFRMALFALRDIQPGEELTYDYNFSLFNPADGQECKCGSDNCRGVIGGKSQRIRQIQNPQPPPTAGRVGRPRKNQAKKATNGGPKELTPLPPPPSIATPQIKPLSHAQRTFVLEHHCFLLRNLKKYKKVKEKAVTLPPRTQTVPTNQTTFLNHLNALRQPRNMRTRRIAQAEEDPVLKKTVHLANVMRDIWNTVFEAKDDHNEKLSIPFMSCPSKRKVPEYYQKVAEPIDLSIIEQNIETGVYKTVEHFDADMIKLFTNVSKFYGRTSILGIASARLKKIYNEAKKESLPKFENVLGVKTPAKFLSNKKKGEEEDIIRCICGMFRDEGLMIQCERCLVWQHTECVRADENTPSYHCEKCVHRKVNYEISMDEYTEHGHQYYMTLLRGDLQLRQGDTVYVLRDIPIPGTDKKHTYNTIGEIKYSDLDIFRIERLWKDSKNGQRFAYGHHYLRPHETYHEPTRRFFPNEVMRVPLYEAVPVELIISHCWVMDINTYCKGRPIGAPEEHIYICEYRVDKSARLFSKVSKSKFPICTKTYAFEVFDTRLKISRTYTPHDLDPAFIRQRGRKPQDSEEPIKEPVHKPAITTSVHIPSLRTPVEQKARLNGILLKLLNKMPTKNILDISYLLEGGRRRKKQTL